MMVHTMCRTCVLCRLNKASWGGDQMTAEWLDTCCMVGWDMLVLAYCTALDRSFTMRRPDHKGVEWRRCAHKYCFFSCCRLGPCRHIVVAHKITRHHTLCSLNILTPDQIFLFPCFLPFSAGRPARQDNVRVFKNVGATRPGRSRRYLYL